MPDYFEWKDEAEPMKWTTQEVGGEAPPIQYNMNVGNIANLNPILDVPYDDDNEEEPALLPGHKKIKSKINYDGIKEDVGCEFAVTTSKGSDESRITGLMIFYVNTGNISVGAALDLIDKVKSQYVSTERALKKSGIEVMWMPRIKG